MSSQLTEVYLGDGLYVSFDGFMITLRAPRRNEDHWVGLEPEVLHKFLEFCDQIRQRMEDEQRNKG
jgi:hypothetical protein